jgi:Icc-related predicted phosphoesterase
MDYQGFAPKYIMCGHVHENAGRFIYNNDLNVNPTTISNAAIVPQILEVPT